MDPLVEGQETRAQQQLSLEDSHSSLKWLPPSKSKEEHLQASTRKKQLIWNQHDPGHPPTSTILQSSYSFLIDNKSLCEALILSNPQTSSIHNSINSISSFIFIQWNPGHSAISGNVLPNKAAIEAITIATDTILPVPFSSSIEVINETIHGDLPKHKRVELIWQHRKASHDAKQINNRKDDILSARLRSGYYPSFRKYLHRLDQSQGPICTNCRLNDKIFITGSANVLLL